MIGIPHQTSFAPPVRRTSVRFIATSMAIIEIKDIPIAVLKAVLRTICRDRMNVSSAMDVINPLKMASVMIARTGQAIPVN